MPELISSQVFPLSNVTASNPPSPTAIPIQVKLNAICSQSFLAASPPKDSPCCHVLPSSSDRSKVPLLPTTHNSLSLAFATEKTFFPERSISRQVTPRSSVL